MIEMLFNIPYAYADGDEPVRIILESENLVSQLMRDPWILVSYLAIIVVLPVIVTLIADRVTQKMQSSEGYVGNRSEYVTRARFDKEINCVQELSRNLLLLIQETKACSKIPSPENNAKWGKCRLELIKSIGDAAPFLNYLDLSDENGVYCGVKRKAGEAKTDSSKEGVTAANCQDPLFEKQCACKNSADNAHPKVVLTDSICGIPNADKNNPKNLYTRACEILALCERTHSSNDFSCMQTGECRGNSSSPFEYETYLDCRYARFVNCAYCRLNAIEYGRKSLRKKNRRDKRRGHFPWRLWENHMANFDQECPYKALVEDASPDDQDRNE